MKRICGAIAPLLLALSGCSSTTQQDFVATASDAAPLATTPREKLNLRIAEQARAQNVPETLVHAIVKRESNYNPSLRHGPYWGLMQIRHDTARSMGYEGPASGLLDPETNMTYAVAYLANAYRVAGGDEKRAQLLYMRGFYCEAKRKGLLEELHPAPASLRVAAE